MSKILIKIKRSFFKYLPFWIMLLILLFFSFTKRGYAQSMEQKYPFTSNFVISAYYSPLPSQSIYVTGTYEGDIRLNGDGVHSADNSIVYPGMLAAPPTFPFGTKMLIPGLGIGTVHDRGGSIKGRRLDVWMGHGEEGLKKALAWGLRELPVTIYGQDVSVVESINLTSLPLAQNIGFRYFRYFKTDLTLGDEGESLGELQRFLKKLGFYEGEITKIYDLKTKKAVMDFQVNEKILDSENDFGAGHFGPKTRISFEAVIERRKGDFLRKLPKKSFKKNDRGIEIQNLQEALKELGYLNEITGIYDAATEEAVYQFQRKYGILLSRNEFGAGFFGPRTQEILRKVIDEYFSPDVRKLGIPKRGVFEEPLVFVKQLKAGDRGDEIRRLQEELKRLHFLNTEPTDYFGSLTSHALFKFQQSQNIVSGKNDSGAGNLGPKTREKLNNIILMREKQNRLIANATEKKKMIGMAEEKDSKLIASVENLDLPADELIYGMRGAAVTKLQQLLKKLGYFEAEFTSEYFGDRTRKALIAFQLNHGLISAQDDPQAGVFNKKTKETLQKLGNT